MEKALHVHGRTRAMLAQIELRGYVVSVHRIRASGLGTMRAKVEMHAIQLAEPENRYIVRLGVDEDGDVEYRAAYLLAEMVGAWLEA